MEGDHGGVVIARLEHNQILAGAEGVGVGGHRFDGHAGLTSLLADFVAGAHLPGVDGLVAGQRDLDAVGAGEHGGSAAVFTAVGDIGPGIVEATSLQRGVIAQVEDAGNRLFTGGQQVFVYGHVGVAVQLKTAGLVVGGNGLTGGVLAVGQPRVDAKCPRCLHAVVVVHGEGFRETVLVKCISGGDGDIKRVAGDVGGAPGERHV